MLLKACISFFIIIRRKNIGLVRKDNQIASFITIRIKKNEFYMIRVSILREKTDLSWGK